jgi:chorismate mutase/prephenate dehydratase
MQNSAFIIPRSLFTRSPPAGLTYRPRAVKRICLLTSSQSRDVAVAKAKPKTESSADTKSKPVRRSEAALPSAGQIARLDREILTLIQDRANMISDAVKCADQTCKKFLAASLSGEQLRRIAAEVPGPLSARCTDAIIRELLSGCRELVKQPRIAFMGPIYSFSHLAAIHRFGQSVEFVPVATIAAVFEDVHRGHSDYGLVPVENSTDGRIADTLDMFTRLPVRITGEIDLKIHHFLLGKCPRTDVKEVYSKPQAISQCRNWLAKHLPAARTVEVTSTSTAAQLAGEKPGAAAIASIQAGVHYGLEILAEKIEDNHGNVTRFAVIGGEKPARTGNDRTALLFQTAHRPGALEEALKIFKRYKLNLTWIESFPVPGMARLYLFFVEMEAHESDVRCRRAIAALHKKTLRLEVLGSFPAATAVE